MEATIEIKIDEYHRLLECERKLKALETLGVADWKKYSDAMELAEEL